MITKQHEMSPKDGLPFSTSSLLLGALVSVAEVFEPSSSPISLGDSSFSIYFGPFLGTLPNGSDSSCDLYSRAHPYL